MDYDVKNLHNKPRSYVNNQGQRVEFAPYEQKYDLKSRPPRDQELWQVEPVEETVKSTDTEYKGGDN